MDKECLFCKIISRDIPADIVFENEYVLGFRDIAPQAPQHILFVPKEHIATLNDVSAEDMFLFGQIMSAIKITAEELKLKEAGYRVVFNCNKGAGQEVFHIHAHLLGGRVFNWPPG